MSAIETVRFYDDRSADANPKIIATLTDTLASMSDSLEFPPVTGQDILNCSFSSWYTKYHRLSPRARIIKPLPEAFLNFLKADGIVLPGGWVPTVERANNEELHKSDFRDRGS